jgi:hypothetical protein
MRVSTSRRYDLSKYLDDDEYRTLQTELAANPELGDVMPRTRGFRKMGWADARRGKGRRGGLRIIYYHYLLVLVVEVGRGDRRKIAVGLQPGYSGGKRCTIIARFDRYACNLLNIS